MIGLDRSPQFRAHVEEGLHPFCQIVHRVGAADCQNVQHDVAGQDGMGAPPVPDGISGPSRLVQVGDRLVPHAGLNARRVTIFSRDDRATPVIAPCTALLTGAAFGLRATLGLRCVMLASLVADDQAMYTSDAQQRTSEHLVELAHRCGRRIDVGGGDLEGGHGQPLALRIFGGYHHFIRPWALAAR